MNELKAKGERKNELPLLLFSMLTKKKQIDESSNKIKGFTFIFCMNIYTVKKDSFNATQQLFCIRFHI
jgi:hypothetical protein